MTRAVPVLAPYVAADLVAARCRYLELLRGLAHLVQLRSLELDDLHERHTLATARLYASASPTPLVRKGGQLEPTSAVPRGYADGSPGRAADGSQSEEKTCPKPERS